MAITNLPKSWRARAAELERYAPAAAEAFRACAEELEDAQRDGDEEELTLAAAAAESGYAERTLREKVAAGEIPNAGRKHAPRIRRADLPRRRAASDAGGGFDPSALAARVTGRSR